MPRFHYPIFSISKLQTSLLLFISTKKLETSAVHACYSRGILLHVRSCVAWGRCHLLPTMPPSIIRVVVCVEALKLVQVLFGRIIGTDKMHVCATRRPRTSHGTPAVMDRRAFTYSVSTGSVLWHSGGSQEK